MFPWWWIIGFAFLVAAMAIEVQYLIADIREKRNVALVISSFLILLYATALVSAIIWGYAQKPNAVIPYFIKAGIGTCVTVSLLTGLHIADVIMRRRK